MISVVIKNFGEVSRQISKDAKQATFATAVALTRTAKAAVESEKEHARRQLDNPTPFTLRGFRFEKATKRNLSSRVYIMPIQAGYLYWQIKGGTRPGRSKSGEALPVNVALNKYGNIVGRGKGKIKRLMDRADTFVGTVRGVYGLWQRGNISKRGKFSAATRSRASNIRLLVRFVPDVDYKKRFDFYGIGVRTVDRIFEQEFDKALAYALKTAR